MLTIVGAFGALAAGIVVGSAAARGRVGRLQPTRGRTGAPIFETDRQPIFETDRDPNRITRRDVRTMRQAQRPIFPTDDEATNTSRFQCSEVANYLPGWQKQEWNRAITLAERGDRSVARNVIAMLEAGTFYPYFTLETSKQAAHCMHRLLDSMVYDYEHQQTTEQQQPAQNPMRFDPRSLRRLRR